MSERWKLDKYSFIDTKDNSCLNFGLKDISRVILQLNNYEDLLDNYEQQIVKKGKDIQKLCEILHSKERDFASMERYFRGRRTRRTTDNIFFDFELLIRNQVCNEIRESCKKYLDVDLSNINNCQHRNLPAVILAEILDKIEQAKSRKY